MALFKEQYNLMIQEEDTISTDSSGLLLFNLVCYMHLMLDHMYGLYLGVVTLKILRMVKHYSVHYNFNLSLIHI